MFGVLGIVPVLQRVLDRDVTLAIHLAGGCLGLHGQDLIRVTEFFEGVGVGSLYIIHDESVEVHELGEVLAEDRGEAPVPGHVLVLGSPYHK